MKKKKVKISSVSKTVNNDNGRINDNYHFFFGWDADGAPVEEYPPQSKHTPSK